MNLAAHSGWWSITLLVSSLLLNSCGSSLEKPGATTTSNKRPNIVVVLLDDLGYSDLGSYGSEINTPNIDSLAQSGHSFSQFYVHPRCSPTRAALLTGVHPHQVGFAALTTPENAKVQPGHYQGYLSRKYSTLAEHLSANGYKTYMSGKWHLGEAPKDWPRERGFDRYFGLISGASSYYELIENQPRERRMALDDERWYPPDSNFYMTDAITQYALEFLDEHELKSAEQPFFLYLAYTAPHWPLHAPDNAIAEYDGVYASGWETLVSEREAKLAQINPTLPFSANTRVADQAGNWEDSSDKEEWQRRMQTHAAMVTQADYGIGRVLSELESMGQKGNTIVLVFSDNGASGVDVAERGLHIAGTKTGARGSYLSYGASGATVSNTPFKEHKGTTYEGGVRSPLIVSGLANNAASAAKGAKDHESVFSVIDLAPSLLSLTGLSIPTEMEGTDVSRVLSGETKRNAGPIFWEHLGWRGIRSENLKAVSKPDSLYWALYNLSQDPQETNDLAKSYPDELASLVANWERWSQKHGIKALSVETLLRARQ